MKKITLLFFTLLTISIFGQDKLTSSVDYGINNGDWQINGKNEYTYNANGYVVQEDYLFRSNFDNLNPQFEYDSRNKYSYNANNRITEYLYQSYNSNNNSFETLNRDTYTYNNNNQILELISYELENANFEPDYKSVFSYDSNNRIIGSTSYYWNGNSYFLRFEYSERITVTYNSNNIIETVLYEIWNGNAWKNEARDINTYDSNNKLVLEEFEFWENGSWKSASEKTKNIYDTNGNKIKESHYELNNGVWSETFSENFAYDTNKLMVNYINPFKDKSGLDFLETGGVSPHINQLQQSSSSFDSKTLYYYNFESDRINPPNKITGRLIEYYDTDNNTWFNQSKRIFEYDNQKNLTKILYYNWDGFQFTQISKLQENEFNAENKIILSTIKNYNENTFELENTEKTQYIYGSSGKNSERIYQIWVNNQWVNNYRRIYAYNGSSLASITYYKWENGNWINNNSDAGRDVLTSNTLNLITTSIYQVWNGSNWENSYKREYSYNSNKQSLIDRFADWENGAWVNDGRREYIYNEKGDRTKQTSFDKDNNETFIYDLGFNTSDILSNYINPFNIQTGVGVYYGAPIRNSKYLGYTRKFNNENNYRTTYFYGGVKSVLSVEDINVNENISLNINVYPNPTTSILKIDDSNFAIKNIEIFNVIGKKVLTSNINKLNLNDLSNGVYLLKLQTKEGNFATKRIIKN